MNHSLAERAILSNLSKERVSMDPPKFTNEEMLEGLPPTTPNLIASDVRTIKAALSKLGQEEEEPEYVVFSCVPPSTIDEMVERPQLWGGVCMRMFYSADFRKLIVKLPKPPHETVSRGFESLIREEAKRQGVRQDLISKGSETIKQSPYAKEADSAWGPRRQIPGHDNKWPTLVLEVGLSENLHRLHIDLKWWFSNSQGQVKVVLVVSIQQKEPKVVLERWELQRRRTHSYPLRSLGGIPKEGTWQNNQGPAVPTMVQKITYTLNPSTHTMTSTGGPLVIPFHKIFLNNTAPYSIQGDFVFTAAAFEQEIAMEVWEAQGFLPRPQ